MTPRVHMFTSTPGEMDTNSFLIETSGHVVAVDTQFLGTPARLFRKMLDTIGKPLHSVVITHPHPDHFNGTDIFLQGLSDVPILSTAETLEGIRACATKVRDKWLPMYGDEYPILTRFPNTGLAREHHLRVDGSEILIHSIGAGEARDISIIYVADSRDLILGDVLYDRTHAWVFEQHSREWLAQLEDIKRVYRDTKTVYSGHGGQGPLQLVDEQREYIERFRDIVLDASHGGAMTAEQKSLAVARVKQTYPQFKQDWWVAINVGAMAREIGLELVTE
jgi:glyoxylase-like metal-dependent hydrolase (beta-lactamase superfamily II)